MPGDLWQVFEPPPAPPPRCWRGRYAAPMRDGTCLMLPFRDFGANAMAGFIANQASFAVLDRLAGWLAEDVAPLAAEIVVGLPTLGHTLGQAVARALKHSQWAAPGMTRKLWYDEALSVPTHSVTSPQSGRRIWLDPNLLPRLRGRRVLLVDDVVSTGNSARAGLALLEKAGIVPVGFAVAMIQGEAWRATWPPKIPVFAAFSTPVFERTDAGWASPEIPSLR